MVLENNSQDTQELSSQTEEVKAKMKTIKKIDG